MVSAEKACFLCRTEGHGSAENRRKVSETKITEKYFIHLFRVYVEFLEITFRQPENQFLKTHVTLAVTSNN